MTTKKAETGRVRGNQTPNTPDVDESKLRRENWRGADTGKMAGNQTPNTPNKNETD
jgi:hypothetical protein